MVVEGRGSVAENLKTLKTDGNVEYAEPDFAFFIRPPGDPKFSIPQPQPHTGPAEDFDVLNSGDEYSQWHLNATGIPQAWSMLGKGSQDIRVLVIDTGTLSPLPTSISSHIYR
jgi:hypothetical protein